MNERPTVLDVVDFDGSVEFPENFDPFTARPEEFGKQRVFTTQDPFVIDTLMRGFAAEEEAADAYRPACEFVSKLFPTVKVVCAIAKRERMRTKRPFTR